MCFPRYLETRPLRRNERFLMRFHLERERATCVLLHPAAGV